MENDMDDKDKQAEQMAAWLKNNPQHHAKIADSEALPYPENGTDQEKYDWVIKEAARRVRQRRSGSSQELQADSTPQLHRGRKKRDPGQVPVKKPRRSRKADVKPENKG